MLRKSYFACLLLALSSEARYQSTGFLHGTNNNNCKNVARKFSSFGFQAMAGLMSGVTQGPAEGSSDFNAALLKAKQEISNPHDNELGYNKSEGAHPRHDNISLVSTQLNATINTAQTPRVRSPAETLSEKYKSKFCVVQVEHFPHCEIYLCGTLHVSKSSVDMVQDVVRTLQPNYVVLELCEARLDSLMEEDRVDHNLTFYQVFRGSIEERSLKVLGMGLLTWMQIKAANLLGSKLGGELSAACKEAYRAGSTIILGDRLYGVTIQRIFDKLSFFEKLKMAGILIWEVLTMSLFKLKDYVHRTQHDDDFVKEEVEKFGRYLPAFAQVVISERDEYIAQTLTELAKVGFGRLPPATAGVQYTRKGKIVAVVGAGHLPGIRKHLVAGGVTAERLKEISSSSKHENTWPGDGLLHVVDAKILYEKPPMSSPAKTEANSKAQ